MADPMTAPALDLDALEARLLDAERNDLLVAHGVRHADIKWIFAAARERDALAAHWCKDGETLAERLQRERDETVRLMGLLAAERQRAEQAVAAVTAAQAREAALAPEQEKEGAS